MTLFDQNFEILESGQALFNLLNRNGDFVLSNLEIPLPFKENSFDVVFSSGVLEHYDDEKIVRLLREYGKISRKALISLVPNAASLPYRIGKLALEAKGKWQWGYERPLLTLRPHYEAAGLKVIEEVTVGIKHSIRFLRDAGLDLLANQLEENLLDTDCGNGYLLAVLAHKKN